MPQRPPVDLEQENQRLKRALARSESNHHELRELLEQITAAPWHPALYQRMLHTPRGPRALVWIGGLSRVVDFHPDVDTSRLAAGDLVYLDHGQGAILADAGGTAAAPTDTAAFLRFADDGRLVVRSRDDELLLEPAGRLRLEGLRAGHLVLFDRASRIALGRMETSVGKQYLMEEVEDCSRASVGGSRASLDELVAVLTATLVEPELARTYELEGQRGVLLYGPPGCGKTLMARAAAAELQRLSGRRCRFAAVRPGEFESAYVGETAANIRACFATLRETREGELAILFLDEIESVGRMRGAHGSRHADSALAALLAEIDGFAECGRVAIVAATNRRDLLDTALLSRLADVEIPVPRPDRGAAREIFAVHLPASLPYAASGASVPAEAGSPEAEKLHSELIESVVSRLYAPNAGTELCTIQLRDGTTRTVQARELASGRLFKQIAVAAREQAFRRHARGEGSGLRMTDAAEAVGEALVRLSTTLSVANAHAHLDDLPEDIDVVRVETIRARPAGRHRYLHAP